VFSKKLLDAGVRYPTGRTRWKVSELSRCLDPSPTMWMTVKYDHALCPLFTYAPIFPLFHNYGRCAHFLFFYCFFIQIALRRTDQTPIPVDWNLPFFSHIHCVISHATAFGSALCPWTISVLTLLSFSTKRSHTPYFLLF